MFATLSDTFSDQIKSRPPSKPVLLLKLANLVISFILLLGFMIFDHFYKDSMMDWSGKFSVSLIENHPYMKYWAWIFTYPVFGVSMSGALLFLFILRRKPDALIYFFMMTFSNGVTEIIKLVIADSRPCFMFYEIGDLYCSCSFGKPSGHSANTILFYLLLFNLFYDDLTDKVAPKVVFLLLMLAIVANVGFSRIYYGAHSFNQVIIGYLLGYFYFSIYFAWSRQIRIFVIQCLALKKGVMKRKGMAFWIIFSAYFIVNCAAISFWEYDRYHFEDELKHPYIDKICFKKCLGNGEFLADRHLASLTFTNSGMFVALGFALGFGSSTLSSEDYYKDSWVNWRLSLKRVAVIVLLILPVLVSWELMLHFTGLIQWAIVTGMMALFALLFFYSGRILTYFKADVPGDFFGTKTIIRSGAYEIPAMMSLTPIERKLTYNQPVNEELLEEPPNQLIE